MAPERFSGQQVTSAVDTYSLACVLYETLTGETPFEPGSLESLFAAHLATPPPRPSAANPDVPAALAALDDEAGDALVEIVAQHRRRRHMREGANSHSFERLDLVDERAGHELAGEHYGVVPYLSDHRRYDLALGQELLPLRVYLGLQLYHDGKQRYHHKDQDDLCALLHVGYLTLLACRTPEWR